MTDWLPIESAPRDGTPVLGWGYGMHHVTWACASQSWEIFGAAVWLPTHWQPLPKPPSPPSEQKGE